MLSLGFYPHLDLYHSAFRAIALAGSFPGIDVTAFRIFDYYSIFPFDLSDIRMRGSLHKKLSAQFKTEIPYKWNAQPAATFLRMQPYQDAAISGLCGSGIIIREDLNDGLLRLSENFLANDNLTQRIEEYRDTRQAVWDFLTKLIDEHGLSGENGLKGRTGLADYQYDVRGDVILS